MTTFEAEKQMNAIRVDQDANSSEQIVDLARSVTDGLTTNDGSFYRSLSPMLHLLRGYGWSEERLAKNDLLSDQKPTRTFGMVEFWRTAMMALDICDSVGVNAVILKSVRTYPYSDSNVDLLIPWRSVDKVERALLLQYWNAPGLWDTIEQLLIERKKRKLMPRSLTTGHVGVHLYGALSWRYQDDIGLLSDGSAEMFRDVPVEAVAPSEIARNALRQTIRIPSDTAELVIQAAHVSFENYRLTLGEAVHVALLVARGTRTLNAALGIARTVGCELALRIVVGQSLRLLTTLDSQSAADLPLTFPINVLDPAFAERRKHLTQSGHPIAGVVEYGTNATLHRVVRRIRARRRRVRGIEDYR